MPMTPYVPPPNIQRKPPPSPATAVRPDGGFFVCPVVPLGAP